MAGDSWVERAEAIDVDESPPASTAQAGVVLVAATETAAAADVAVQTGIGDAEVPVCLVATQARPATLVSYVSERAPTRPPLGVVDATAERPGLTIREELQAVENVAGSRDLLGLTTAVEDVRTAIAPADEPTNIVVPAFDSLLGVAPTDRVVRLLAHVAESVDDDGQVVVGLDYTAGSRETLETLQSHSDAMLWAERDPAGQVGLDFESLRP